jgi:hypothetical protein
MSSNHEITDVFLEKSDAYYENMPMNEIKRMNDKLPIKTAER